LRDAGQRTKRRIELIEEGGGEIPVIPAGDAHGEVFGDRVRACRNRRQGDQSHHHHSSSEPAHLGRLFCHPGVVDAMETWGCRQPCMSVRKSPSASSRHSSCGSSASAPDRSHAAIEVRPPAMGARFARSGCLQNCKPTERMLATRG